MSGVQIVRVFDELPDGFEALQAEARAEGFGLVDNLAEEWRTGARRFDREGEALFAAFLVGELAAVGGVTLDEKDPDIGALRMRRLYVRPARRRSGVGRAIAGAMIQQGFAGARVLTVNAGTPDAPAFWEAMGFRPDRRNGRTHALHAFDGA